MGMDILKILKDVESKNFILNDELTDIKDDLKELLDSAKEQNVFYVGTSSFVLDYYKNNPSTEWKIKNVFQLGYPYLFLKSETNKDLKKTITRAILKDQYWFLFVFAKEDFANLIIGFNDVNVNRFTFKHYEYGGRPVPSEELINNYFGRPLLKEDYSYQYYFDLINYAIETNKIPEITEEEYNHHLIAFNSVPSQNFFLKYLNYLSRYKKSVIDDFGFPTSNEKLVPLKNFVQIIQNDSKSDKIIFPKQNDVITNGLFIDEYSSSLNRRIFVATGRENEKYKYILRSFDINPFFLWALLNSEFAQDFCLSEFESWWDDFVEIPIEQLLCFIPERINEPLFKKMYEVVKQTKLTVHNKLENNEISSFYDNNAKEIILKDLTELRLCFKAKAYKATIIMAGSILEAFLIDWLSEIDGINYFNKKEERYGLLYYINRIHNLKKSTWDDAAKKAKKIRIKRNLVHAKLYIDDNDISKETCTEVINYLEYVVKTRWK